MDKWEVYMRIQQLHKQGFKFANIARNLDSSRTTVYKYLQRSPEEMAIWMAGTKTRERKLDPYRDLILSWLKEHTQICLRIRLARGKIPQSTSRRKYRTVLCR